MPTTGPPRLRALLLGGTAVAFGLSGAAAVVAAPSIAGATTTSAATLYHEAIANIVPTGSVHFTVHVNNGGYTETTAGDAGQTSGRQLLVLGFGTHGIGRAQIRLVGTTAYVKANKIFYEGTGITTSVPPASTWISMSSSDKEYGQVAAGLTISTIGSQTSMDAPYTYGSASRLNGVKVVGVRGTTKQQLASGKEQTLPVTVFVRTSGKPLPVGYAIRSSKHKYTASVVLSRYGKSVNVTAPATSTPASKYGG